MVRWLEPSAAKLAPADSSNHADACSTCTAPPLTEAQVREWRERKCCAVDGVWPAELVARVAADASAIFRGSTAARGATDLQPDGYATTALGHNAMAFPCGRSAALNEATLHPRLLAAVAQLLGKEQVSDLRLTQSEAWLKSSLAQEPNHDQRMHCDFPNHTLTMPPADDSLPEAVSMLAFWDDVVDVGGATYVVPRCGQDDPAYQHPLVSMPGVAFANDEPVPYIDSRDAAETFFATHDPSVAEFRESLYTREEAVRFHVGTILFYQQDTWHRGSPLKDGADRVVQNITFKRADVEWITNWNDGWGKTMYDDGMPLRRILATASLDQRAVLGFPVPGHRYWTKGTIEAVQARYGPLGMDVAPYKAALVESLSSTTAPRL